MAKKSDPPTEAPFSFEGDENLQQSVTTLEQEIPAPSPEKIAEAARVLAEQGITLGTESTEGTAAPASTETPPLASNVKLDKKGVPYDEKIHSGTMLKSGEWRLRKTPLSTIGTPKKKPAAATPGTVAAKSAEQIAQECRAAGFVAAQLTFGVGQMIGGEEFKQDDDNESEFLAKSYADYFQHKGITDIPPGVALSVALLGYVGKRFTRPQTKAKLGRVKNWIMLRLAKRKLVKAFGKDRVKIIDGKLTVDGQVPGPR